MRELCRVTTSPEDECERVEADSRFLVFADLPATYLLFNRATLITSFRRLSPAACNCDSIPAIHCWGTGLFKNTLCLLQSIQVLGVSCA